MRNRIVIVPYDPSWPGLFQALSHEISQLLGARIKTVHHIGSTAVPGLSAKPKIDLIAELVSTDFLAPALADIQALQSFTFHGDPYGDGLWAFTQGHGSYGARLYICEPDNPMMRRWIRFRDLLRAEPALAQEYEKLKRNLAAQADGDWRRYTGGKRPFIDAVLGNDDTQTV